MVQVDKNSHFFTEIEMIINAVGSNALTKRELLLALRNTKKNGYEIRANSGAKEQAHITKQTKGEH